MAELAACWDVLDVAHSSKRPIALAPEETQILEIEGEVDCVEYCPAPPASRSATASRPER